MARSLRIEFPGAVYPARCAEPGSGLHFEPPSRYRGRPEEQKGYGSSCGIPGHAPGRDLNQVNRSYIKTTTNDFDPPKTAGDNWILGRLRKATVDNQVPALGLVPSAGTAPNATATTGVGLP
jgi:hypothetical protein